MDVRTMSSFRFEAPEKNGQLTVLTNVPLGEKNRYYTSSIYFDNKKVTWQSIWQRSHLPDRLIPLAESTNLTLLLSLEQEANVQVLGTKQENLL